MSPFACMAIIAVMSVVALMQLVYWLIRGKPLFKPMNDDSLTFWE
jgi:hypothetical protein